MKSCQHIEAALAGKTLPTPSGDGCRECLEIGDEWVHLRLCVQCGHVGCCDDSKNKHATKHFHATKHPVILSFEPNENWGYCYVDDQMVETAESVR